MTPAQILEDIERSRQELLDLGNRNPLISCSSSPSRGLEVVDEMSDQVFETLVGQGRKMSFLPRPDGDFDDSGDDVKMGQPDELDPERHTDTRLQTTRGDNALQALLRRFERDSRTLIEEQGVNTLYLAIGFLHWLDPAEGRPRRAPLILLPVTLHRSNVRERITLSFSGEELSSNLSLEQRLKNDFGIELPPLPEGDSLVPTKYCKSVRSAVKKRDGWRVEDNEIRLAFFSFTKLLMYRDLAPESWPEGDSPAEHPILGGLIHGEMPVPDGAGPAVVADIDQAVRESGMATILDADGSQTEAILRARQTPVMVIQGPPGTGKSQTIANLIADAVVEEKRVLFVAEKMAALSVVRRRLEQAGLGDASLELHSRAANKKRVLEDLARTWELGRPQLRADRAEKLQELEMLQSRLGDYASAVNRPMGETGVPPRVAYLRHRSAESKVAGAPTFEIPAACEWTGPAYAKLRQAAIDLNARREASGPPCKSPFWGMRKSDWMPSDREPLHDAIERCMDAARRVVEDSGRLVRELEVPEVSTIGEADLLLEALDFLESAPDLSDCKRDGADWIAAGSLTRVIEAGTELRSVRERLSGVLIEEAWERDVFELRRDLISCGTGWLRVLKPRWYRVKADVLALGVQPTIDPEAMLDWVDGILTYRARRKELDENWSVYEGYFVPPSNWSGVDWPLRGRQRDWLSEGARRITEGSLPKWVESKTASEAASRSGLRNTLKLTVARLRDSIKELERLFDIDQARMDFWGSSLSRTLDVLEAMRTGIERAAPLARFNQSAAVARQHGLEPLVDVVEHYPQSVDVVALFDRARYEAVIRKAFAERPVLEGFEWKSHEGIVKGFAALDRLQIEIGRERAAYAHYAQLPMGTGGRVAVLRAETAKKSRHKPIRKLLAETGSIVQKIKPIFLMSPLSVAQFLEPGAVEFDVVIFDEASQVKVVDGYGAIVRGKRLIVVGDSKQLPPTDFFSRLQIEEEEDSHAAANIESLLRRVETRLAKADRPMLRWHYRSKHESLIAFSNNRFYDDSLVVFPSCVNDKSVLGLSWQHVPSGIYRRGERRANNPGEAEAVAAEVMEHARRELRKPIEERESLMVATFSVAQRDTVSDKLEIARRQDPSCEEYFSGDGGEPFEVKNLEAVQGDERDVVFISIGYGRDPEGRLSNAFGPVNGDGGERRMNVLCSRARNRCVVFSNFRAAEMKTSENAGVNALRAFLHLAETGDMTGPMTSQGDPENEFESSVCDAIVRHGYEVDAQIGCAGYRIDLAVRDPHQPGRYLLGIECDGATYHSTKYARDRDRLRQEVLEARGWKIHRIWSTSWFQHPEDEIDRAVTAIRGAALQSPKPAPPPVVETPAREELQREDGPTSVESDSYCVAALQVRLGGRNLHEVNVSEMIEWLVQVVTVESPVHFDVATRRITAAAGITRRGNRIVAAFDRACRQASKQGVIRVEKGFLYDRSTAVDRVRDRSQLETPDQGIQFVAPEELDLAVRMVVEPAHGMSPEEIPNAVSRLLGIARTSSTTRAAVDQRIEALIGKGSLFDGGEGYLEWRDS